MPRTSDSSMCSRKAFLLSAAIPGLLDSHSVGSERARGRDLLSALNINFGEAQKDGKAADAETRECSDDELQAVAAHQK
jgi:hypothetical protein